MADFVDDIAEKRELTKNLTRSFMVGAVPLARTGELVGIDVTKFQKAFDETLTKTAKENNLPRLTDKDADILKRSILIDFMAASRNMPLIAPDIRADNTASPKTIFMADPDKNPTDTVAEQIDNRVRWEVMKDTLNASGADVKTLNTSTTRGGNTEVFTRDAYIMVGKVAYLPDIAALKTIIDETRVGISKERVADKKAITEQAQAYLQKQGIETHIVKGAWFEGGNVLTDDKSKTMFMGMEPWAAPRSLEKLITKVNETQDAHYNIVGVPLAKYNSPQGDLYHLDLGMSEKMANGKRMIYPGVTDPSTYQTIERILGPENLMEITYDDAKNFATNFEQVGKNILMTKDVPSVVQKLKDEGLNPITPDQMGIGSFDFSQGGVHCMTNTIPEVKIPRRER